MRGLEVLEALAVSSGEEGVRLSDLAAKVDLDKATTARLVGTLCEAGYAFQDVATRRYRLAGRVLALASQFEASLDLPKRAGSAISDLQKAVNETIHLGIREGDHVIYIAKFETSRPVRISSGIGQKNPLHSTALGKAIMSAMSESERDELIASLDLKLQTKNTISDGSELRRDVARAAERGYSIDDRENEDSVVCVGAPIVNSAGRVIAAISISGPAFRMSEKSDELGELCSKTALEIGNLV